MPFEAESRVQPPTTFIEGLTHLGDVFASELAFRAWYERSLPRVYAYVFHRCGRDLDLAEELTQQAFVEAVRSHGRFRGDSDPTTWVVGIARHRLVDHFRRIERDARRFDALASGQLGRAGLPASTPDEEPDEIDDALAALPPMQRAVLILHYMDRLSVRDVARGIGKSEAATASLLARGRDAFRRAYREGDR